MSKWELGEAAEKEVEAEFEARNDHKIDQLTKATGQSKESMQQKISIIEKRFAEEQPMAKKLSDYVLDKAKDENMNIAEVMHAMAMVITSCIESMNRETPEMGNDLEKWFDLCRRYYGAVMSDFVEKR